MDPPEESRLERLNRLIHASGFEASFATLEDLLEGPDAWTGWVDREPYACVARRLPDATAEARVLHEVAHWTLGHEFDFAYRAAVDADASSDGGNARGPWEIAANALAAALVDDLNDMLSDPSRSIEVLTTDTARFL